MKTMFRIAAAMLAASSLTANAWAGCVSPADMAALKTAAMQQELMVAAFSCHDIDLYNRFVRAHQPELIQSDARLRAYFVQRDGGRRGEANYHTYKTELANDSSLRSIGNSDEFCDRAGAEFDALEGRTALAVAIDGRAWAIEATYHACRSDDTLLTAASAEPPSPRTELARGDDRRGDDTPFTTHGLEASRDGAAQTSDLKTPAPHRHLEGDSL